MSVELYRKHRPSTFKEVVGQDAAIKSLVEMGKSGKIPHVLLFTGPSGCGKTTLARIMRLKLKCADIDFTEKNAAKDRGIDMVRDIGSQMSAYGMGGQNRVYLLDEVHALTSDAQSALLKILEDTPNHVYFMLCTTDPHKLKETIKTRCTHIKCKSISNDDIRKLVTSIAEKEGKSFDEVVVDKIVDVSNGSARQALVTLHQILGLDTAESQLAAIESTDVEGEAIAIARALISEKTTWKRMAEILAECELKRKEDPEGIRRMVMGYAKAVLLKSGSKRAAEIIDEFRDHWFDCGDNGLVISCYHIING